MTKIQRHSRDWEKLFDPHQSWLTSKIYKALRTIKNKQLHQKLKRYEQKLSQRYINGPKALDKNALNHQENENQDNNEITSHTRDTDTYKRKQVLVWVQGNFPCFIG